MSHEGSRQARDRGATRSKAEKARPPTQPVPQVDIVPGRLNEAEWIALLTLEEGEDVVGDVLADLLTRVLDCAFSVYLTQQCVPFTISQAREAMLQITEWRFLARDEGESAVAEDPTWGEDEEPLACTTDAWAQGSVPVLHAPTPDGMEEHIPGEDPGNQDQFLLGTSWTAPSAPGPPEHSEPSAEPIVTLGSQPTLEMFPEVEPRDAAAQKSPRGLSLYKPQSLPVSAQPSLQAVGPEGALRSQDLPLMARLQTSVEKGTLLSTYLSFEDLFYSVPMPDAAGDRPKPPSQGLPRVSSAESVSLPAAHSAPTSAGLEPADGAQKTSSLRLDPARLPRHWVRPVAEVLMPDTELRPLETYRSRPRGRKSPEEIPSHAQGPQTLRRGPDVKHLVSPAELPFQSCALFRSLGAEPTVNLGLTSPTFGSKLPFISPGFRFFDRHPRPSEMARTPSPKLWPGAKWPKGWEREVEQLKDLWGSRTRVPPQGPEPPHAEEGVEDSGWPLPGPQVLETTSQQFWKPMIAAESMKLAAGVSMWNRGTQQLLRSGSTQEAQGRGGSHAKEQQPIQTGVAPPQVTMTQLDKKETPKAWLLPAKPMPHSGS